MKKELFIEDMSDDIFAYTISNDELEVTALNFGATITSIKTKDKDGKLENIVASFHNPIDYINCPDPYLNAIVGPVAGRIAYGEYELHDKKYKLSINNGCNHLHGGSSGVSKKIFDVDMQEEKDTTSLHFSLTCDHDVDGYHGLFQYDIYYRIVKDTLKIEYNCIPEVKTILNMTSHLYFNLTGDMKHSILYHYLKIPSSEKLKIHEDGYPYQVENIKENSTFDFEESMYIGKNYAKGSEEYALTLGYDTPFLLNKGNVIELKDPISKRVLTITTDQKCVVVYSANYFKESMMMNQKIKAYPFCAIALETQDAPNGINITDLATNQIFDKEHPYHQSTTYRFTIGGHDE